MAEMTPQVQKGEPALDHSGRWAIGQALIIFTPRCLELRELCTSLPCRDYTAKHLNTWFQINQTWDLQPASSSHHCQDCNWFWRFCWKEPLWNGGDHGHCVKNTFHKLSYLGRRGTRVLAGPHLIPDRAGGWQKTEMIWLDNWLAASGQKRILQDLFLTSINRVAGKEHVVTSVIMEET